jgi:molybdate transport system permease protein
MQTISLEPLWLTAKLACLTTVILLIIGMPLAYWLAYSRRRFKFVAEALVAMPLVLPPSVLGFYLLLAFSPQFFLGGFLERHFDLRLVFSFSGLVVGSVIFSMPFMVQPLYAGLSALSPSLAEASFTLGKSGARTFFSVLLPNIKPAALSAVVLTFAHTVGEFGVVLMIGGNIPGETRVASIAIYDEVEALRYGNANTYALILFAISFAVLLVVYRLNRRPVKVY